MTVTNHALAGGILAVALKQPMLVFPLAFASHFVLDALPHFGFARQGYGEALKHKYIYVEQAINLVLLVFVLVLFSGHGWLPYLAAFVAISPDLMWPYRYFFFERKGKTPPGGPITRFHRWIQWCERPWGIVVEYFATVSFILLFLKVS